MATRGCLFPHGRYRRIHRKSELRDREAESFLRRWKRVFFLADLENLDVFKLRAVQ